MDFDFSDDQVQLRDAVRRWADKSYSFERRRGIVKAGGWSPDSWSELAELGLTTAEVGDLVRQNVRGVGDHEAPPAGLSGIDMIVAHAEARHDLELGKARHHVGPHGVRRAGDGGDDGL